MKDFMIVASASKSNLGIGNNGKIPWKIDGDMEFFKKITMSSSMNKMNAVIMGRKTLESLPKKCRPLPDRINIVMSRDPSIRTKIDIQSSVFVVDSLHSALMLSSNDDTIDKIFVIGGETIYNEAIECSYCSRIYMTEVLSIVNEVDTFFPKMPSRFKLTEISGAIFENNVEYRFTQYEVNVTK
jgi:dihydrofolate reductase